MNGEKSKLKAHADEIKGDTRKRRLFQDVSSSTTAIPNKKLKLKPVLEKELVTVRLTSGEIVRMPRNLLAKLRRAHAENTRRQTESQAEVLIQKLVPASVTVPFSGRLGESLKTLSAKMTAIPVTTPANKQTPIKLNGAFHHRDISMNKTANGTIPKTIVVRAAYEPKSLLTPTSPVKKVSLLEQLGTLPGSQPPQQRESEKIRTMRMRRASCQDPRKGSLVPVTLKLSSNPPLKLIPLSAALKQISNNTIYKPTTGCDTNTITMHAAPAQQPRQFVIANGVTTPHVVKNGLAPIAVKSVVNADKSIPIQKSQPSSTSSS